jgi:serine/threonine protein kinase
MFSQSKNYETLKIVDFGLATETGVKKYMFPKCGTPGYVAPEILNL